MVFFIRARLYAIARQSDKKVRAFIFFLSKGNCSASVRDNGFYNIQSKPIAVSNFGFNIISAEQFCKYLFLLCFWNSIAAVAYAYRKLFFAPLRGARQAYFNRDQPFPFSFLFFLFS